MTVLDLPFHGVFIRAPLIEEVGDGLEVIAEHDGAPVAVADSRRLALTFHPELSGDDRIHRHFLERMVAPALQAPGLREVAN
jgi:5'-phosphate synthase pdxT subunit